MAGQVNVKNIEWIVDIYSDAITHSKSFTFQNRDCYLEFHDSITYTYFKLYFISSEELHPPPLITVCVSSNSKILGTPRTTLINSRHQEIWRYSVLNEKNSLKIEISFDAKEKEDKCIQTATASYLNTDLSLEGLAKDFSELLANGLDHDVEMICGKQSLKTHKIVLCARSEVFKAMLEHDMQERRTGVVVMRDMDADYFQDFIRYLYTDAMPELTFEKAIILYEIGDEYHIKSLMLRCSDYLQDSLSHENAFDCFVLADGHSDQKLKDRIISYILDKKLYLEDEHWLPFCETFPKAANEIYRLSYKSIAK